MLLKDEGDRKLKKPRFFVRYSFIIAAMISILIAVTIIGCIQERNVKLTFTNFSSEDEFRDYLSAQTQQYIYQIVEKGSAPFISDITTPTPTPIPIPSPTPAEQTKQVIPNEIGDERYSLTNVQVEGIDEPDIVKVDGENIYLSFNYPFYPLPKPTFQSHFLENKSIDEGYERYKTIIISAYPPERMEKKYEIKDFGQLLIQNKTLIIFSYNHISAYNISNGEKMWNMEINGQFVTARLYEGKVYLITRKWIDYYKPCPIEILNIDGKPISVRCMEVFHPIQPIPATVTYNIMVINPKSGEVEKKISLIGSYDSVIYMSYKAIYVTYFKIMDQAEIMFNFLSKNRDMLPIEISKKIEKLRDYDISNKAKYVEIQVILQRYLSSLNEDERKKFENEFWNRFTKYRNENIREIERTIIIKLSLDLEPIANGEIPGKLLNQFSLDEYNGYLRVATTVGGTNDLYILDENLKIIGSLKNFGEDERIYAVRFIGDRGYIVTFRQVDPFFVIDLSNPEKPEIKGKLKIPGFSSYLHPISEHLILGIGKEKSYVKISLFDVSDAENPRELSKYILKEYWSDILTTHHAFLLDKKHKIFFLPASNGGYVFKYDNDLELIKVIDERTIRAVYIDDYLYIIGEKIVVFDENSWEKVNEFSYS